MWSKITSYVWCCKKDELMILYLLLADLSYYLILISWQLISGWFLCLCSFNSILHVNSLTILLADMALNHLSVLRPLLCESLVRHARCPLTVASRVRVRPSLCPGSSQHPSAAAACIRLYATKKAKGQWRQHWNWSSCTDANVFADWIIQVSFSPFSSKQRQRASQRRWTLIQLWWKTSSVWMRWRRTWTLFLLCSKMSSHVASASEPHQVVTILNTLFFYFKCKTLQWLMR